MSGPLPSQQPAAAGKASWPKGQPRHDDSIPAGIRSFAYAVPSRLEKYLALAGAGHVLVVILAILLFIILEFFGWTLPLFDALKLPNRDIEFVIVESPPRAPRDPNTKLRADRASRAGGKKIKELKQAPTLKAAGSPTKNVAPKPTPSPPTPRRSQQAQRNPSPSPQNKPTPRKAPQQPSPKPAPNPAPTPSRAPSPPPPKVIRRSTASSSIPTPSPLPPAISAPPLPPPKNPGTGQGSSGPIGSKLAGIASGDTGGAAGASGPKALPGALSSPRGGSGFGSGGRNSIDQFGSAGGGGGPDGVDARPDVDFGPYIAELQRRIKRNWVPPADNRDKRIVAVFTIRRDGRLVNITLKNSSGVAIADKAAVQAIRVSAPFRPLPPSFRGETVDVLFTFDYNVLSGRSI